VEVAFWQRNKMRKRRTRNHLNKEFQGVEEKKQKSEGELFQTSQRHRG